MSEQTLSHQLILTGRQQLLLSGVCEVDTFDDTTVVLNTSLGELTVKGSSLQVQRLNIETGDLSVEGQIDLLAYRDSSDRNQKRIRRWFR